MKRSPVMPGPLLPSEASSIVSLVAGLFGLSGVFSLLGLVVVFARYATAARVVPLSATTFLWLGLSVAVNVCYCVTAKWLYEGRQRGAYLAMAALAVSLARTLSAEQRPDTLGVLFTVTMLVGLALAWPHLSDVGRDIDAPLSITRQQRDAR